MHRRDSGERSRWYGRIRGAAAGLLLALGVASAAQGDSGTNLVDNGGFEIGTAGWQWEQWDNKPLPGIIDKQDHSEGTASFKMGLAGASGSRWISTEVPLKGINQDCTLMFSLKGKDLPPNDAHVRVGVEGKGWLGSELGKSEVAQVGGTFDWKKFTVPIPADRIKGSGKLTLFIYHDNIGKGTISIDGVSLTTGKDSGRTASSHQAAGPSPAEDLAGSIVINGGFENGTDGWMWEQWDNKPLPGVVDRLDHARGSASFKMGLPGASGSRYMAQEIPLKEPNKDYLLTFWLKPTNLPENAGHVRLGIEGRGWLGSDTGKSEVAQTGGSSDWKQYKVPIPASSVGDAKKMTLFVYDDQMGTGSFAVDGISIKPVAAGEVEVAGAVAEAGATLIGETSRPDLNTYALNEKVEITFQAMGLKPDQADLKLVLNIVDEHDQPTASKDIPIQADKSGRWKIMVVAPSGKLGFYRVRAKLSNGVELKAFGTRPAGFLTYAVVPDPAKRVNYGELESRFGMQGGFGPWGEDAMRYLGARWVLDSSLEWRKNEPDRAGQFAEALAGGKVSERPETPKWQTFPLPTLMAAPNWAVLPDTNPYMTGVLTAEGEKAWADYCKLAATVNAKRYPDLKEHIYQITWEPIFPWGFKGTDRDLVRIYQIAYPVLHAADPKAVVAGPCRGINRNDVEATIPAFQLGLGNFVDAYSTHPYFSIDAEKDGFPRELRRMKQALEQYSGKNLPMMGTEQGWSTEEDPSKDLTQARGLIRQNLITLGEGYRFNFAFYIHDYRMGDQKGHGYYYNLIDSVPWGAAKVSPRPIAPAYAAQSLLLDGHHTAGAIEWLGDTAWGYAFQRNDDVVLALWDYGGKPRDVSIPTGTDKVQVYDWMGNGRSVTSDAGGIQVTLGPEPIYVDGVAASIWGDSAVKMLTVDKEQVQIFPGDHLVVAGHVQMPAGKAFQGTVVLEPDTRLGVTAAPKAMTVEAGKSAEYKFDLPVPAGTNPGTYPVKLLLHSGNSNMAAAGARARLASPIAIRSIDPADTARGMVVTLADEQGKGFKGTLDVELKNVPNTRQSVPVTVAPGGTRRVAIDYPRLDIPASRVCEATATVTVAGGYKSSQTAAINFMAAPRLAKSALPDGNAAKWTALSGEAMVVRSPEYYRDSFAAQLRYAWDDRALYVTVDVSDDVFYQPYTGLDIWKGDCLQLAFNLDPRKNEAQTGNLLDTNIRRRASELNVALTPKGPEVYRSVTFDAAQAPRGMLSSELVRATIKQEKGRIFYDLAISWKALGTDTAPNAGELVGVAATVNNSDSAEQKDPTALGLFGGICPTKDSEKFGLLVLAPAK